MYKNEAEHREGEGTAREQAVTLTLCSEGSIY